MDKYVVIEKSNKKEGNIYYGLAILFPFLRIKFSYKYLKKGIKTPEVFIFSDHLLINNNKINLFGKYKSVKSIKIINGKNYIKLLEFNMQWLTGKGPINDEFRVLIPSDCLLEAQNLVKFYK